MKTEQLNQLRQLVNSYDWEDGSLFVSVYYDKCYDFFSIVGGGMICCAYRKFLLVPELEKVLLRYFDLYVIRDVFK